jgi:glycosyltransferase involved in cell wall biosynthesis
MMPIKVNMVKSNTHLEFDMNASRLSSYPMNMSLLLPLSQISLDATGIPHIANQTAYDPTIIAQYALAHWNLYLATNDDHYCKVFLTQANWLIEHESHIGDDAGGWPISFPHHDIPTKGTWLSALTQGNALSVLIRAFQLTGEQSFLDATHRAVRTFERDILDGGVSAPVGSKGVFFEEVAVYPAAHKLSGFIFAIFGLYDYVDLTGDIHVEKLIQSSLATMHGLLKEFDVGFWTCSDLVTRHLSSDTQISLQVELLQTLAELSGCEHCSNLSVRWKGYRHHFRSRARYFITSRCKSYWHALWNRVGVTLFPRVPFSGFLRICVPITAFPLMGGVRTVLANIAQVTTDSWQIEYLTQHVGPNSQRYTIHRFGTSISSPWHFPFVWLYFLSGFWKISSLMRRGTSYHVILVQDGIYTGAFAALAAKLAGIRVVCIDHGNLSLLHSATYRAVYTKSRETRSLLYRLLARLEYVWYRSSLSLLAKIAARFIDYYFIPGVAGDGIEEVLAHLGVQASRIARFANMIEVERHIIPGAQLRSEMREEYGIPPEAIVIAIVCRLAPEKGLEIALEAINRALTTLSPEMSQCVRVVVAGDGPLRKQIEESIRLGGLGQACLLWGEASPVEVITILGLSDIFLFTSWRAAGYPLAILEAMASSCAVIAATDSLATQEMLAEGRGIVLPVGDANETARAIVQLVSDPELCRHIGQIARDYVALHHSPTMLKRALMRATFWSELDQFLKLGWRAKDDIKQLG